MNASEGKKATERKHYDGMGTSIAIGLSLGVALGAAFDNVGVGIVIGIALGAAFGATFDNVPKKER